MPENCWISYHLKIQDYQTETQLVSLFEQICAEKLQNALFKIFWLHRVYILRQIDWSNRLKEIKSSWLTSIKIEICIMEYLK